MARSYTVSRNQAGIWTKNNSSANLLYLDQEANDAYRHICAMKDWPFLEQTRPLLTIASQQFYNLPYDCGQVREISVVLSTKTYTPKLCPSRAFWDQLNLTSFTSDYTEWYFVFAGQVGLWPKPASSNNTINIVQKTKVIDLQFADITNTTVDNIANGSTTLTGTGSPGWTNQLVGRYIQIAATSNTSNTGDGVWYQISAVPTASTLTLTRAYGGITITTAAAAVCTIGQMPILPEDFHNTPWKKAAQVYWEKEADGRAVPFMNGYMSDLADLVRTWSSPTTSMVIDDGDEQQIINPNLVISL